MPWMATMTAEEVRRRHADKIGRAAREFFRDVRDHRTVRQRHHHSVGIDSPFLRSELRITFRDMYSDGKVGASRPKGVQIAFNSLFEAFIQGVAARLNPIDLEKVPTAEEGVTHAAVTLLLRPAGGHAISDTGGNAPGHSAEILFIKRAERAEDPW